MGREEGSRGRIHLRAENAASTVNQGLSVPEPLFDIEKKKNGGGNGDQTGGTKTYVKSCLAEVIGRVLEERGRERFFRRLERSP